MTDLYLLVQSLSPSEKRYFKLFSQRSSSPRAKQYVELFDAIDKNENIDDDLILKKYRKASFIKNFSANKGYLFDAILTALRLFNEDNFIEWQLRENVFKIKILSAKGLDNACKKLIQKTKEQAWLYEEYTVLLDTLVVEKMLFNNNRIGAYEEKYSDALIEEENKALRIIDLSEFYRNIWQQLAANKNSHKHKSKEEILKRHQAIITHPKFQEAPEIGLSYSATHWFYAAWHLYYMSSGDNQKLYFYAKKMVENHESRMEAQPLMSLDPLARYYNFLLSCFYAEQWQDMEIYLEKLRIYDNIKTVEQEIRKFHNYCWCALLYYLGIKEHKKAAEVVNYFEEGIAKYQKIRPDFQIVIQSLCGVTAYFNGNENDALDWWEKIINQPKNNIEVRIQCVVRIYKIIVLVKQKEYKLLESEITNTKRFIQNADLLNEREQVFFKMLAKNFEQDNCLTNIHKALSEIKLAFSESTVINPFVLHMLQ